MDAARSDRGTMDCSDSDRYPMPGRPSLESRRGGFTLVELLVVIAVIALLVGLAVVAIGGARRAALDSSDKARLRGLAQAS